jgi:hypothetical protein
VLHDFLPLGMVTIPRPTKSLVGLYEITPERPWDASLFCIDSDSDVY